MNFSTLREAYDVDTFDRKPKKKKSRSVENVPDDYPKTERIEKTNKPINIEQYEDKRRDRDTSESDDISDTKTIEPYYDEDLEKYLNVKDFKNTGPYTPEDTIAKEKINTQYPLHAEPPKQENTTSPRVSSYKEKDIFYKNVVNIGLFALIGILIIFLCDQIAEIAINQGMQKTIQILEPYLQNKIVR